MISRVRYIERDVTFRIVRVDGKHYVDGKLFEPKAVRWYRKKTLTQAVQMLGPFSVETLEGTMEGSTGDWLLIGVNGEMYPCAADVFEKTYEYVPERSK